MVPLVPIISKRGLQAVAKISMQQLKYPNRDYTWV